MRGFIPRRITIPGTGLTAGVRLENRIARFERHSKGAAPPPHRAISIYDMLIPSYEFRDIPRDLAAESRSFGKRHGGRRRKEEAKSYLTNADRCHYILATFRIPELPFPFSMQKPLCEHRVDELGNSLENR